ncbi:hypothetical protein ACFVVA_28935 [Kitasatospora sp. NPDC058048]|uniref:hypothetical protein n=1 Tax=Kitasatospora sp. NPDC058048 TaxID=3346313 RepID=UPI0036DF6589
MTARTCVERRVWALLATVADDRTDDIDSLLDDLTPTQLGDVVTALASLALAALMPPGADHQHPGNRAHIANALRADLLQWTTERPADGQ